MEKLLNSFWNLIVLILDFFIRKLFRIKLSDEQFDAFLQFIKFGIVGVSNTLINLVVYWGVVLAGGHYLLGQALGFLVSVINAFYWNNKYVFAKKEDETRSLWFAFFKTFISYAGTGLVLESLLLIVWIDLLHINKVIAPIVTLLITIPINFILNKLWAFKDKKNDTKKD